MSNAVDISRRIVEAVLAQKLAPGMRLGEQPLAALFGCSRTIVREALTRLAARGIVTVSSRRGWYVVDLSAQQAQEAFQARLIIETGLLHRLRSIAAPGLARLHAHLRRQQAALEGNDVGLRSFLLGDFHVCLAECLGNALLAEMLRDLTVRTTLIAMRHQSGPDAARSYAEHVGIVAALRDGDNTSAERLMAEHLGTWELKLSIPVAADPLAQLRHALLPIEASARKHAAARRKAAPGPHFATGDHP